MDLESIDTKFWTFVWNVIQTIILAFIGIYTWIVNRSKANRDAIDVIDKQAIKILERVTLLENDMSHIPSHKDLGDLHEKLNDVSAAVNNMEGTIKSLNNTLSLINQHLIATGGK